MLHLLDWVRLHKADVDEKAQEVLQSESPTEHHGYWDVVSTNKNPLHRLASYTGMKITHLSSICCFETKIGDLREVQRPYGMHRWVTSGRRHTITSAETMRESLSGSDWVSSSTRFYEQPVE